MESWPAYVGYVIALVAFVSKQLWEWHERREAARLRHYEQAPDMRERYHHTDTRWF